MTTAQFIIVARVVCGIIGLMLATRVLHHRWSIERYRRRMRLNDGTKIVSTYNLLRAQIAMAMILMLSITTLLLIFWPPLYAQVTPWFGLVYQVLVVAWLLAKERGDAAIDQYNRELLRRLSPEEGCNE